jgi:hypothetical protein
MAKTPAQELLEMKEAIERSKAESQRMQGQLDQVLAQRSKDFGVSTDTEAETYLQELQAQAAALEKEIIEGLAAVKEELGWE